MLFHISLRSHNIKTLCIVSLMIFCQEWSAGSNRLPTYGVQVQSVHVREVTYSTEPEDSRCRHTLNRLAPENKTDALPFESARSVTEVRYADGARRRHCGFCFVPCCTPVFSIVRCVVYTNVGVSGAPHSRSILPMNSMRVELYPALSRKRAQ